MTERRMDTELIGNKLDAIGRTRATLARIGPLDASRLEEDGVIAAAVERLLCRMAGKLNVGVRWSLTRRAVSPTSPCRRASRIQSCCARVCVLARGTPKMSRCATWTASIMLD